MPGARPARGDGAQPPARLCGSFPSSSCFPGEGRKPSSTHGSSRVRAGRFLRVCRGAGAGLGGRVARRDCGQLLWARPCPGRRPGGQLLGVGSTPERAPEHTRAEVAAAPAAGVRAHGPGGTQTQWGQTPKGPQALQLLPASCPSPTSLSLTLELALFRTLRHQPAVLRPVEDSPAWCLPCPSCTLAGSLGDPPALRHPHPPGPEEQQARMAGLLSSSTAEAGVPPPLHPQPAPRPS